MSPGRNELQGRPRSHLLHIPGEGESRDNLRWRQFTPQGILKCIPLSCKKTFGVAKIAAMQLASAMKYCCRQDLASLFEYLHRRMSIDILSGSYLPHTTPPTRSSNSISRRGFFLSLLPEPRTSILGTQELFIEAGSTINLTCIIHTGGQSMASKHIYWNYNGKVKEGAKNFPARKPRRLSSLPLRVFLHFPYFSRS